VKSELKREARGQLDGTSAGPQVRGAGKRARARASDNQEQVGRGSGPENGLRQIFRR
jgi:hypothetical protein